MKNYKIAVCNMGFTNQFLESELDGKIGELKFLVNLIKENVDPDDDNDFLDGEEITEKNFKIKESDFDTVETINVISTNDVEACIYIRKLDNQNVCSCGGNLERWGNDGICTYCSQVKKSKPKPLALLNTTILTNDGEYYLRTISLEAAKSLFNDNVDNFISAIGHDSTTEILNSLLETTLINTNRIQLSQEPDQLAICFKLRGRPAEGQILTLKEIEEIGYDFKLLERKK